MQRYLALVTLFLIVSACRPTPFQVKPISDRGPRQISPGTKIEDPFDSALKAGLSERYKKANSPVFAIIDGYYRLPNATPFGAARVVQGYSYQTHIESIEVESSNQPIALSPISGDEAVALHQAMNSLLDMGVKLYEISMSNALAVAEAERQALKDKSSFLFSQHLPPSVDYLMSIYKTQAKQGPVLIGRVVGKDGRLLAFRVMREAANDALLGKLVLALFEDSINRL